MRVQPAEKLYVQYTQVNILNILHFKGLEAYHVSIFSL